MEGRYSRKSSVAALLLAVLVLAVASTAVEGQYCGMSPDGFNACREACTKTKDGSPPPSPSDLCCTAVRGAKLSCLCSFANSPFIVNTYKIDKAAAMKLPVTCNVDPNFHC